VEPISIYVERLQGGILTARFHSQAIGLIPIAVLLAAGTISLLFVKGGDRLEE
jgi:MFS transporter, UMF1 family